MNKQRKSPVLIYDGECGICVEWINYWQKLTSDEINYRSYQEAQSEYSHISLNDFQKYIHYIDVNGTVRSGANAAFAIYEKVAGMALPAWLYHRLPGFAIISEIAYKFFSNNRGILRFFTHLFWGRDHKPAEYTLVTRIFLRALACIYLSAFISFGTQIIGLIGSDGILPLDNYLLQLKQHLGASAYWKTPMVFWFFLSDRVLHLTCLIGAGLSVLLLFGLFQRTTLVLLYILYLSLFYAGQTFMTFQWDLLLLEAGFLAIFLPSGMKIVVWLYRWLVFRFIFLGGLVKIISHDPTWDNLTALNYHFETQPLPTIFSWYAHHLSETLLTAGVVFTLLTELVVPFLIFAPRRFRMLAASIVITFQFLIIITGNYNFFNLLTIAICLFLYDDAFLKSCIPIRFLVILNNHQKVEPRKICSRVFLPVALIIAYSSVEQMAGVIRGNSPQAPSIISRVISPWHIVQNYGPFAVMMTTRHEIVIEGSSDGKSWKEYQFAFKPGNTSTRPAWATPHQPRLDWQMWFAALSQAERNPWFQNLLYRLLLNSESVTDLLASNPFQESPPVLIRALFYEYQFSSPREKKSSGQWWNRQMVAEYYPPVRVSIKTDN